MSHVSYIKTVAIRDTNALKQAVEDLKRKGVNCGLLENAAARMWSRSQEQVTPYVLSLPDIRFDVGFAPNRDGSFTPVFDQHGALVGSQIGNGGSRGEDQIGRLMQAYTTNATINAAVAQGYSVESANVDEKGQVQLVLAA